MGSCDKDASHSFFAETTGWVIGSLKGDWERQLWKTTMEQGNYGQLRNTFDFGAKKMTSIAHFHIYHPSQHLFVYPEPLYQTLGDFGQNRETGRMHHQLGENREPWLECLKLY